MKNLPLGVVVLVAALVGAVGGAAGAAIVTWFLLSPPPAPRPPSVASPDTDLVAHLDSLREENAALESRIRMLEQRPAQSRRALAQGSADLTFEEEVRAWMAAQDEELTEAGDAAPVALQSEVEQALITIRRQEEAEEQRVKLQHRDEFITDTIAKIAPDLGLSQLQVEDMRNAWTSKAEADAELGRLWEEGMDLESAGQIKEENEAQHQANLQAFLSPEQYESYTDMVNSWRGK